MSTADLVDSVSVPAALPLLESKLAPPPHRAGTVPRTRLLERLRLARRAAVVVIEAPAGYGKTSLLADWARKDRRPFAWYAVDEEDDDPVACLTYLAAAVSRALRLDLGVVRPASAFADAHRLADALGDALATVEQPFVLAVDDAHLIKSRECIAALAELADRLPARVTVALATRTALPFELDELRAEGRVLELGADELRMTDAEAGALLRTTGLELGEEDVAVLNERAEGWSAGLYLAALTLRSRGAPTAGAFGGADRFVTDYFRDELLAGLPEREVEFLTRVSVLTRMCGPLCDAILGRRGSAKTLTALAHANLFVIPLGGERHWFRFHRLFQEMLREELERRDPEVAATLAARAATWSERNGDLEAAVEYAFAAGDSDRAVGLVEEAAVPAYRSGRLATIARWLSRIDPELLRSRPAIAVIGAWAYALGGRPAAADHWTQLALAGDPVIQMPDGSPAAAWQASLRAFRCADGPGAMQKDAELGVATTAPKSQWGASARMLLGVAALLRGDAAEADAAFADAVEVGTEVGANVGVSIAFAERALLASDRGDRVQADVFARTACEVVHESGLDDYGTSAVVYAASARTAIERGDRERAADEVARIERLSPRLTYAIPWLAAQARIELALAHLSLGNTVRAVQVAAEIDGILEHRPDLGFDDRLAELRSRLAAGTALDEGWGATLTNAELRLLPLLTTHLSYREIAERLGISRNTVKTQAISVYRRLEVSSRSEAIARAGELGLL